MTPRLYLTFGGLMLAGMATAPGCGFPNYGGFDGPGGAASTGTGTTGPGNAGGGGAGTSSATSTGTANQSGGGGAGASTTSTGGASACPEGYADCDGDAATVDPLTGNTGCEVDLTTNTHHCGKCNRVCSDIDGTPYCLDGECGASTCQEGFGNCDGSSNDNCEVQFQNNIDHCGGCGITCAEPHATMKCTVDECAIAACAAGYGNCNTEVADGCEVALVTIADCGDCDTPCVLPNAVETCATGTCAVLSCEAPFANCDDGDENGCETNTDTNLAHCGGCTKSCGTDHATPTCTQGECHLTCAPGFDDCNLDPEDGCEASLVSDPETCGACENNCAIPNATVDCVVDECIILSCTSPLADCDTNWATGCEINTNTDESNCGECNKACVNPNGTTICLAGLCVPDCDADFGDCDGIPENGCELPTTDDKNNCGGCDISCSSAHGASDCVSGSCEIDCNNNFGNCDNDAQSNGCEASLLSDPNNCDACGTQCGDDGTCACSLGACSGGTVHFSEDFSDNSKGWQLQGEWEIGPTMVSTGQQVGSGDPANDHSSTSDNGIAGIVIGGNYVANPPTFSFAYLTSPTINLSAVGGTVLFTYWHQLNADADPFCGETVEVYDGATWVTVWTNATLGDAPLTENGWTRRSIDITAQKNAAFAMRFGHKTAVDGQNFVAYVMSGWNVDDVSLSSATCN